MNAEGIHDSIIASYRSMLKNSSNFDSMYETLRTKIDSVNVRRSHLEESIRFLRSDYENQIEQQMREQQMLQAELESMKN